MDNVKAADGFSAMGSRSRLEVLRALVRAGPGGLLVGDLQKRTGIAASTLAHHLKTLTTAGLLVQEKQGRAVINRANFDHLASLAQFILHECCIDEGENND
ncbi:MAG: transcriptional regulator [Hyphomicrobiales bacterium]|nr:MAG: transcriptional regulator [Hyphomicrobiales bacterium]